MWICKYCLENFSYIRTTDKANHAKHCEKNPNRSAFYNKLKEVNQERFNKNFGIEKEFKVTCKECESIFSVIEREKLHPQKEQYFCSRVCANSIGGKAKSKKYHYDDVAHYTTIAWRYHKKECLICKEQNIVAVHHLNEIHNDNRPENLIPLCPTHHQYMHSKHKVLIESMVNEYVKNKWG